jgi:hypothetical protein
MQILRVTLQNTKHPALVFVHLPSIEQKSRKRGLGIFERFGGEGYANGGSKSVECPFETGTLPVVSGMQPDHSQHPVWSVYDELRTARLNVKYLQCELKWLKLFDGWSEIVIAIATTSSVGSFWFLQNAVGAQFWKTAGAIAVVLSIIRPILKFGDRIQAKEKLLTSYCVLDHDLNCIRMEIRHRQKYDNSLHKDFLEAMDRKAELVKADAHSQVKISLRLKCEILVLNELPTDSFYVPES